MSDYTSEPIEYATYDPTDNKLRVYSGHVGPELYARFKTLKFQRAYKQGCFFATWTPNREDLVLELVDEITDEDSTLADRAHDRSERFSDYSQNAGVRSSAALKRSNDLVKRIPFGQPVQPPGHHSRRGHLNTLKKSRKAMDKFVEEHDKSGYWSSRAAGVLSHAERKHLPGPTLRRIKKLKADRRRFERDRSQPVSAHAIEKWLDEHAPVEETSLTLRINGLTDEQGESFQGHLDNRTAKLNIYYDRWIAHLTGQIEFWQAIYDASPAAVAAKEFDLKVGNWIFNGRGWAQITRVNKRQGEITSVSIDQGTCTADWMPRVVKFPEIKGCSEEAPA